MTSDDVVVVVVIVVDDDDDDDDGDDDDDDGNSERRPSLLNRVKKREHKNFIAGARPPFASPASPERPPSIEMRRRDSRAEGSYSTQFAKTPIARTRLSKLDFSTRSSDDVFNDENEVMTRKIEEIPQDVDVIDL